MQATVLVLDQLPENAEKINQNNQKLRAFLGNEGSLALDLIKSAHPKIQNSLRFLLHGKVICKDLKALQKIQNL